jgi:hypothetical protein
MIKEIEYLQPIGRDQATGFVIFHPNNALDLEACEDGDSRIKVGTDRELQWNWREPQQWRMPPRQWETIQRYEDALAKGRAELRRKICNDPK